MSTQVSSERTSGWVTFAAIVMFSVAFLRIVTAISYFAKSHIVPIDSSVSDALTSVSQSAQTLVTTTQSTINGLSCS
jgi:uncharacterized protein YpmB